MPALAQKARPARQALSFSRDIPGGIRPRGGIAVSMPGRALGLIGLSYRCWGHFPTVRLARSGSCDSPGAAGAHRAIAAAWRAIFLVGRRLRWRCAGADLRSVVARMNGSSASRGSLSLGARRTAGVAPRAGRCV